MFKNLNLLRQALMVLGFVLLLQPLQMRAALQNIEFSSLNNRDGLSNSQVNAILKDKTGYVWFGTQSGLNRFDGFRMKTFLYSATNQTSLANNYVDDLQEDNEGKIWVHTSVGYCVYDPTTEQFDRKPEVWLKTINVEGAPQRVLVDSQKNMWIQVWGKGLYYYNVKNETTYLFKYAKKPKSGCILDGDFSNLKDVDGKLLVTYGDGKLCLLDGDKQSVLWYNTFLKDHRLCGDNGAYSYVENNHTFWVSTATESYVFNSLNRQWLTARSYLAQRGILVPVKDRIVMRDLQVDPNGALWVATDHHGLFYIDFKSKTFHQYVHSNARGSIVDNSLQKVYIDNFGAVWVGSYKNGVAYYSPSSSKFNTIPLGDVCTITQDLAGNLWCGTNDMGIVGYNPVTGQTWHFGKAQTGLGTDVVVSSVTMKDGTMYFGTFNGGFTQFKNGRWKAFNISNSGLANNSVWCFQEDPQHRLLIGTLGSGVQIFDPVTEKFSTFNIANSGITSNFINSIFLLNNHEALIGHSQYISVFNFHSRKMTNINSTKDGTPFGSPSINYAMKDSRGILWMASPGGISMYDSSNGQYESINELNGTTGAVGCAVVEDKQHNIWLVSEFIVTRVTLTKDAQGKWNLTMISFNSLDGLQSRQFNIRSAYLMRNGAIAVGGQDGINIIRPRTIRTSRQQAHVLFSGFVLFDHPLTAGEKFEGRVPLKLSLDSNPELDLSYKDKAFTIQLASNQVSLPARCRFLYRMKGLNDKWMMTPDGRSEVTFTNLLSGNYVLEVKVVNGDGTVSEEVSRLKVHIHPPFYLSTWAIIIYLLLVVAAFWYYRRRMIEKQRVKYEIQIREDSIKKTREMNELKLNFFTNVSHELRTPLTLIISPLVTMIRDEGDPEKRRKLELIHRNATRLLNLVNQILDFRKFDQNKEKLSLARMDIVSFVDNICNSFRILANNKVNLSFESYTSKLIMTFDADKVGKIVNNLLSNAYKFTPDGGSITVRLSVALGVEVKDHTHDMLRISVADNGKGISDEEKKHVFERFYQVNGTEMQPAGGSGIGLNLVKKFTELHGGQVEVRDNEGGGSVFIVDLPMDDGGAAKTNAHLESMRVAPVIATVHKAEDTMEETVEDGGSSDALYGVHRSSQTAKPARKNYVAKVLLVDDSDDFREFMRDVLTDYQVIEAVNGQDAWQKIIEVRPDVILSDVMMPVMDGIELCRMVKSNEETASIPFVMLTARLATDHQVEGLESGADDYIIKPFNIDMLNLRIRNLLGWARRSARRSILDKDKEGKKDPSQPKERVIPKGELGDFEMTASDRKFLADVDKYIKDMMGDPDTSVESMSAHLCMSRVQLYKRMVSLTGTTPSEYLRAKRIKRAEELIHSDELNISEIAYTVGFNNPRYFTKYFQEAYGLTPSQYKKKLNGESI